MKSLYYSMLLALLVPTAVSAESPAGISGTVIDSATNRPLPGVVVVLERQDGSRESVDVLSSKRGFFVHLGLQPGRYAVSANTAGRTATCSITDVSEGQMRRVDVAISAGERDVACSAARPPGSLVDPDESADVYRIH